VTDLEQPPAAVLAVAGDDPLDLLNEVPLTGAEAGYVAAARANTLRGYLSDWAEFTAWCTRYRLKPLPPGPATVTATSPSSPGMAPGWAP
jgi:hypothetical protein